MWSFLLLVQFYPIVMCIIIIIIVIMIMMPLIKKYIGIPAQMYTSSSVELELATKAQPLPTELGTTTLYSVLPNILKAYQPCNPSAQIFL